jgi:endonuclease/exonuclease/phosphatase (EEP) superfamily protein YafD
MRRPSQASVLRLLAAAGALCCVGSILALFGGWSWWTELASHFRVQYFAGLATAAAALIVARRHGPALVFAGFASMNVAAIYPLYLSVPADLAGPTASLRVMQSNVFARNDRYDLVLDAVASYRPDLLVVQEMDAAWLEGLAALSTTYPYAVTEPREGYFGIGLYSRWPLSDARVVDVGGVPAIVADVDLDPTPLRVFAIHSTPPLIERYARMRNAQLEEIARLLSSGPRPVILVGDLNVTPWSPYFGRLLRDANLEDSMKGHGPQFTWPAQLWPVRLPIDHCLYSAGVRIVDRQVGPYVGSDHYPLVVDLEVGHAAASLAQAAISTVPIRGQGESSLP